MSILNLATLHIDRHQIMLEFLFAGLNVLLIVQK